jgi:hypothetical protein
MVWMVPLLLWDSLVWGALLAPRMKDDGLCPSCVLAYAINFYFFAVSNNSIVSSYSKICR